MSKLKFKFADTRPICRWRASSSRDWWKSVRESLACRRINGLRVWRGKQLVLWRRAGLILWRKIWGAVEWFAGRNRECDRELQRSSAECKDWRSSFFGKEVWVAGGAGVSRVSVVRYCLCGARIRMRTPMSNDVAPFWARSPDALMLHQSWEG